MIKVDLGLVGKLVQNRTSHQYEVEPKLWAPSLNIDGKLHGEDKPKKTSSIIYPLVQLTNIETRRPT
jgi:hypothetical protein